MLTFEQIKQKSGLADSSFLTYVQLSLMIKKKLKDGVAPASFSEHNQRLIKATASKVTVANMYSLLTCAALHAYCTTQLACEWDLTSSLTSADWENIWKSAVKSSKCVRY